MSRWNRVHLFRPWRKFEIEKKKCFITHTVKSIFYSEKISGKRKRYNWVCVIKKCHVTEI
jgi:hypothetical protein